MKSCGELFLSLFYRRAMSGRKLVFLGLVATTLTVVMVAVDAAALEPLDEDDVYIAKETDDVDENDRWKK